MTEQSSSVLPTNFNPWLEIWYRPRTTIQRIVKADPKWGVYLLIALAGYDQYLDTASRQAFGDNLGIFGILGLGLLIGPLAGIISFSVFSFIVGFVGRLLKGEAENEDVLAALAWAQAPIILKLLLRGIQILIYREELFMSVSPRMEENPVLALLLIPFAAIGILIALWQLILYVLTLAEVNRFSIWRSIATLLIFGVIIVLPLGAYLIVAR